MQEPLTSGGLDEALSAGTAGASGVDACEMPGHAEGPEADDVIALATAQLHLVQIGYSGPPWLGIRIWDWMYVISMLAGAWNAAATTLRYHPVRDPMLPTSTLSWPVLVIPGRCPHLSHVATICGMVGAATGWWLVRRAQCLQLSLHPTVPPAPKG